MWQEHFFVLTPKQLIFTGEQERDDSEETEKVDDGFVPNSELHLKQKWDLQSCPELQTVFLKILVNTYQNTCVISFQALIDNK